MPEKIYKVIVVYSPHKTFIIRKKIETVKLPQPISVRFCNTETKGDGWEEHVRWFWDEFKAEEWLMDLEEPKRVYNKPASSAAEEKARELRMKKVHKMTERLRDYE